MMRKHPARVRLARQYRLITTISSAQISQVTCIQRQQSVEQEPVKLTICKAAQETLVPSIVTMILSSKKCIFNRYFQFEKVEEQAIKQQITTRQRAISRQKKVKSVVLPASFMERLVLSILRERETGWNWKRNKLAKGTVIVQRQITIYHITLPPYLPFVFVGLASYCKEDCQFITSTLVVGWTRVLLGTISTNQQLLLKSSSQKILGPSVVFKVFNFSIEFQLSNDDNQNQPITL